MGWFTSPSSDKFDQKKPCGVGASIQRHALIWTITNP
jgi:hypothetical protein